MSWSMMEPEEPPICECKYDEARDEMDRGDCRFHYDLVDEVPQQEERMILRKKPASKSADSREDAA
jgi:hypothetical protein